jgi:outer membrane protein TolC
MRRLWRTLGLGLLCAPLVVQAQALQAQTAPPAPTTASPAPGSAAPVAYKEGYLTEAFKKARLADPLFRAANAEYESNMLDAQVAGTAYYPQLALSSSQLPNESGARRTSVSLVQPLISATKWATRQEKEPREKLANATLILKESDLARRVFGAFSELALARENLAQNKVRLDSVVQQLQAARRLRELGQGTITDVRDAEVKALQAKSEDMRLRSLLSTAQKKLASIVGEAQPAPALGLSERKSAGVLDTPATLNANAEVVLAEQQETLAMLEAKRSRSAWMPELNATYTRTTTSGQSNNFVGLSWSFPLEAGKFYTLSSNQAKAVMAAETRADKERQVTLETERLQTLVEFGFSEVPMRKAAVQAAELSVTANRKSFEGGVKSVIDVLNSIETVYMVKTEHATAVLALAENLLNLRLQQGYAADDSLAEVQALLFAP